MKKEKVELKVTEEDLKFIKKLSKEKKKPLSLQEIAQTIGYQRTAHLREEKVKVYSPEYFYEAGDLIFKEFDDEFRVSKNKKISFKGGVVLRVERTTFSEALKTNLITVVYEGEGEFKTIMNVLKKKKVSLEFESSNDPTKQAPFIKEEIDPRKTEPPLGEKELKKLEKSIKELLEKSNDFFSWRDLYLYKTLLLKIKDKDIVKVIRKIEEEGKPLSTEEIKEFLSLEGEDDNLVLFSINVHLKEHGSFMPVSFKGWGKWFTKDMYEKIKKSLPLFRRSSKFKKKPDYDDKKAKIETSVKNFLKEWNEKDESPDTVFLTLREVLSGAIKLKREMRSFFNENEREFVILDKETGAIKKAYYFPYEGYIIGFKDVFEKQRAVSGTRVRIFKEGDGNLYYEILKVKKEYETPKIVYNSEDDTFKEEGSIFSKASFDAYFILDKGDLEKLYKIYENSLDNVNSFIRGLFRTFGEAEEGVPYRRIHFLTIFNLLDIVKKSDISDVLSILLGNSEFFPSTELPGFFYMNEEEANKKDEAVRKEILEKELLEKKKKLEEEIKEKARKLEELKGKREEEIKRRKTEEKKGIDEIERQKEKIERRLKLLREKGVKLPPPPPPPKHLLKKKIEKKLVEEKKVEKEQVKKPVEEMKERKEVLKAEGKETEIKDNKQRKVEEKVISKTPQKKRIERKPAVIEQPSPQKSKKRKGKKKIKEVSYSRKKSERRIREEELEIKEAEREALETIKGAEIEDIQKEVKRETSEEETKVVYSEKIKSQGVLFAKLQEALKEKEKRKKDKKKNK